MSNCVLLAQDGPGVPGLDLHLRAIGCDPVSVGLDQVVRVAAVREFDLIVLAAQHGGEELIAALAGLRALADYPPVLLVANFDSDPMLDVRALKCGCDAVVTASVDLLHLEAWVVALCRRREISRRSREKSERFLRAGELEIDVQSRTVRTRTKRVDLTERELQLLLCLANKQGRVCTRQELLESVWGSPSPSLHGALNTHINRIRIKIEDDLKHPSYLLAVYGVGYRLVRDAQGAIPSESDPDPDPELEPVPDLEPQS